MFKFYDFELSKKDGDVLLIHNCLFDFDKVIITNVNLHGKLSKFNDLIRHKK